MTAFFKSAEQSTETKPPETVAETEKVAEQAVELVSRIKASPMMWGDAIVLSEMLAYCRPHSSRTESRFINKYIRPVGNKYGVRFDKKGNIYIQIGDSPMLWSCHTDTVHARKGIQKIEYWVDKTSGDTFFGVAASEKSSCLGADDTAGVWIMLEMIRNGIPGLYIFHRGEECGGIGSRWIADNNKEVLKGIKFAVAFDRRDTGSIITHQRGSRCCSDDFANSLAVQLGLGHHTDTTGSFTDTASYTDHVGECTNISVGYYDAHCSSERLDVDYLFRLRDAICKVDVSKLVEKRKPGEKTVYTYYSSGNHGDWDADGWGYSKRPERPANGYSSAELNELYGHYTWVQYFGHADGWWTPLPGVKLPEANKKVIKKDLGVTKVWRGGQHQRQKRAIAPAETIAMVKNNPAIIADLLEGQGYGPYELKDYIILAGGMADDVLPYYY